MQQSRHGKFTCSPGRALPFGATPTNHGVQFALFSRNATAVTLCIFEKADDAQPVDEILLHPRDNKTGDVWHVLIHGLQAGAMYGYYIDGPFDPKNGFRFNKHKLLIDPYAKALSGSIRWNFMNSLAYEPESAERDLSFSEGFDASCFPKCIVVDNDSFDWQGDKPLNTPMPQTIIYEVHAKGVTAHASSGVKHPGSYRGVVEMIPYLKELGITAVELLPTQEFDEFEYSDRSNPVSGEELKNYWGYSTLAFFAPKSGFSCSDRDGGQVNEFKEMVRELHKAGIEVIMDVVFNHSGEGNEMGFTQSFRGIDNSIYYMLDDNRRYYKNYSGCGNTLNCNHPVVRTFIVDCLRYWVLDMHVDGFRFDLGSILGRDERGNVLQNPPTLIRISEDPVLRHTKIIAEAWDAGGAYQVGSFPGGRWAEWNDRFRDDVRRFWRGDHGLSAAFATRLSGSSDLYAGAGRKPYHSINFVTCHDGFTLNDQVTYNEKHNFLNGENNRDGNSNNLSYNYGFEGETRNAEILTIRNRQVKNMLGTVAISIGTPMFLAGDEFRRTQFGNNNAYCHDNELSWHDYGLLQKHADVFRFFKLLLAFRKAHPVICRRDFFTGRDNASNNIPDVSWFSEYGACMRWEKAEGLLAFRLDGDRMETGGTQDDNDFYIMFNATLYDQYFSLTETKPGELWHVVMDTALSSPQDICELGAEQALQPHGKPYLVQSRSMVLAIAKPV